MKDVKLESTLMIQGMGVDVGSSYVPASQPVL